MNPGVKTLSEEELVEHFLNRVRYGLKSKYYQNSLTSDVAELENAGPSEETFVNEKMVCGSGGCVL